MIDLKRDEQCPHCGRFSNRGLSIDAVIVKEDKVLLIQRGVGPNKGFGGHLVDAWNGMSLQKRRSNEKSKKRQV